MNGPIGIVGLGIMGAGIVELVARSGFTALAVDADARVAEAARQRMQQNLEKAVEKGRLAPEQAAAILERVRTSTQLAALTEAAVVIESVPERLELKQSLFQELDRLCQPKAILATNTSSLSITAIAGATRRPEKVIGLHFINPPQAIPLVEIIPGDHTAAETVAATRDLARRLGKEVVMAKDSPAFVLNRMVAPLLNEAMCLLDEGVASPEDIDKAMVQGARHPMGPLAIADMAGLDTVLSIMQTLERETGNPKYRPARVLQELVAKGHLGVKTGRGIYTYGERS